MVRKLVLASAIAAAGTALALAQSAGAARSQSRCPLVNAAGKTWIVVAQGTPCSNATAAVSGLAAQTLAVRSGGTSRATSSRLPGWVCIMRNPGKPSGACVKSPTQTVVWLAAY